MPIEHKREGNACERCKKLDSEVGKITHYTRDGADLLLCPKCLDQREKSYTEKCPKCKKLAYEHGGLTYYDDSDVDDSDYDNSDNNNGFESFDYDKKPPSFELMCMECYEKKVARERKIRKIKLTIKNFAKKNWKTWISITIAIIGLIIAISKL